MGIGRVLFFVGKDWSEFETTKCGQVIWEILVVNETQ